MLTVAQLPILVEDEPFPANGSAYEKLVYIARYAECGPELFGARPWRLHVAEDAIEVYIDRNEHIREVDWDGRESAIATGSAIFILRLAMRCHLLQPEIELADLDHGRVARIRIAGQTVPSALDKQLFSALTGDRGEFSQTSPGGFATDLQLLRLAACMSGVGMCTIGNDLLRAITVSMLQAGDRIRFGKFQERDAFRAWLGLAPAGLSEPASKGDFITWSVAQAELESLRSAKSEAESVDVGVLCTNYDDDRSWLETGQSLARIHLLSIRLGLSLSVLNQPLQVPGMRARFARETSFCNFPQVVVRVGRTQQVPAEQWDLIETALRQESGHADPCECGCGGDCGGAENEGTGRH